MSDLGAIGRLSAVGTGAPAAPAGGQAFVAPERTMIGTFGVFVALAPIVPSLPWPAYSYRVRVAAPYNYRLRILSH